MKILTRSQAVAVFTAMRTLNEVGGVICVAIGPVSNRITVEEFATSGRVFVTGNKATANYPDRADFAAAYGLDPS